MVIEMDLGGIFKWVVVGEDTFVDPIWLYEYRTSVHFYVDKLLAM